MKTDLEQYYRFWRALPCRFYVARWDGGIFNYDPGSNLYTETGDDIEIHMHSKLKRPYDTYNHHGLDVTLLDRDWSGNCVHNLKFRASVPLCLTYAYELEIMAFRLNFTVIVNRVYDNLDDAPAIYIKPYLALVIDYAVDRIQSLTYSEEKVPIVFYCRKHNIFPNTWTVWLTPFNSKVWVTLVALLSVSSVRKMGSAFDAKLVLFEMYILFSFILRQPVKCFTVLDTLIILSFIIVPIIYESIVVGYVIAPPKLTEYHNVAEFLEVFDKLIVTSVTDYVDQRVLHYEFVKFNITGKYENAIEIMYKTDIQLGNITNFLKDAREQVGVLGYVLSSMISKGKFAYDQSNTSVAYPCNFFVLEQMCMSYNLFRVPFLKEACLLHTVFGESGFFTLWEDLMWTNETTQIMKNQTNLPEFSNFVTLLHLEKIIATWAISSGMCVFVLIFEVGYASRCTILKTYTLIKLKIRIAHIRIMSLCVYYSHKAKTMC